MRDYPIAAQVKPNIFNYATSELSQDAFLCWLFEHLSMRTNDISYDIAKKLIQKIISKTSEEAPDVLLEKLLNSSLEIKKQEHDIDVLLIFSLQNSTEKVYIMIEDKTHSGESRENQLEYYLSKLKVKESTDIVIPVLFKTGYVTPREREDFMARGISLIGYEDIYDIFIRFTANLQEDVILHSWWLSFNENFYKPIKDSEFLAIKDTMTLEQLSSKINENKYVHNIVFKKLSAYLFSDIPESLLTRTYSVQGKGHIDWHHEITKEEWKDKHITVSLYFIWNTHSFSLVVKTAPVPYRPQKALNEAEKQAYIELRERIKSELKDNKKSSWKIRNYYLQIAYLKIEDNIPLKELRENINKEIKLIEAEIDHIMIPLTSI